MTPNFVMVTRSYGPDRANDQDEILSTDTILRVFEGTKNGETFTGVEVKDISSKNNTIYVRQSFENMMQKLNV